MKFRRIISRVALIHLLAAYALFCAATSCFARQFDVLNYKGEKIFSHDCDQFSYIGGGIYESRNKHGIKLLNKNGEAVPIIVPCGCRALSIDIRGVEPVDAVTSLPRDSQIEISKDGLHGLIDGRGSEILPCLYDRISSFGSELKQVTVFNRKKDIAEEFVFNTRTKKLSPTPLKRGPQYSFAGDGKICFSKMERKGFSSVFSCGCLDENGVEIIPPVYRYSFFFLDGLALVLPLDGDGKQAFIDENGMRQKLDIVPESNFQNGVAVASSSTSTSLRGLVDRKFQFVVPAQYSVINPIGKNLFAVKRSSADPFDVIDGNGNKLCSLPANVTDFEILQKDAPENLIIKESTDSIAIYDLEGKLLLETDGWVSENKFGVTLLRSQSMDKSLCGLVDANGNWLIKRREADFALAGPDRIIENVGANKFDSAAFKSGHYEQFKKFLADYNFIGMPRKQVEIMLGGEKQKSDIVGYPINNARCGEASLGLEVVYVDEKVKKWRFHAMMHNSSYYEKNMIFAPDSSVDSQELTEKGGAR